AWRDPKELAALTTSQLQATWNKHFHTLLLAEEGVVCTSSTRSGTSSSSSTSTTSSSSNRSLRPTFAGCLEEFYQESIVCEIGGLWMQWLATLGDEKTSEQAESATAAEMKTSSSCSSVSVTTSSSGSSGSTSSAGGTRGSRSIDILDIENLPLLQLCVLYRFCKTSGISSKRGKTLWHSLVDRGVLLVQEKVSKLTTTTTAAADLEMLSLSTSSTSSRKDKEQEHRTVDWDLHDIEDNEVSTAVLVQLILALFPRVQRKDENQQRLCHTALSLSMHRPDYALPLVFTGVFSHLRTTVLSVTSSKNDSSRHVQADHAGESSVVVRQPVWLAQIHLMLQSMYS
ncbi:unnamed protein product, partial [Amoebophrya sp. A25]